MSDLSRIIEFKSSRFPRTEADDQLVNSESMYGHALASYLAEGLRQNGYDITLIDEDWGWLGEAKSVDFALWYGVSAEDGDDIFIVQFHPRQGTVRKLFSKRDVSGPLQQFQDAVFAILDAADPDNSPGWVKR